MSLTLADIRKAIGDQLRANIDREVSIDVDGEGKPAPVVRLELAPSDPIDYWVTFGGNGIAGVRFKLIVDPAGVDRSAVIRLDEFLSVGTGNGSSVMDAIYTDPTFGGVLTAGTVCNLLAYDAVNVSATFALEVHVAKQGAEA